MKGGVTMGGYIKIYAGEYVYEAKISNLSSDGELMVQLLNGRIVRLDSKEIAISSIHDDN